MMELNSCWCSSFNHFGVGDLCKVLTKHQSLTHFRKPFPYIHTVVHHLKGTVPFHKILDPVFNNSNSYEFLVQMLTI